MQVKQYSLLRKQAQLLCFKRGGGRTFVYTKLFNAWTNSLFLVHECHRRLKFAAVYWVPSAGAISSFILIIMICKKKIIFNAAYMNRQINIKSIMAKHYSLLSKLKTNISTFLTILKIQKKHGSWIWSFTIWTQTKKNEKEFKCIFMSSVWIYFKSLKKHVKSKLNKIRQEIIFSLKLRSQRMWKRGFWFYYKCWWTRDFLVLKVGSIVLENNIS